MMSRFYAMLILVGLMLGGCGVDWFPATTPSSGSTTVGSFSFTNISGVTRNTLQTSNAITVQLTGASTVPITVTGGSYSKDNGTTYTTTAGTVKNGDIVSVQHTSASSDGAPVSTTLTIGTRSATFTSTTARSNVSAFSFTEQTAVTASAVIESNAQTITLLNGGSEPINVINGEYQIDTGTYTSGTGGTIQSGQTVKVRHQASATAGDTDVTTLVIGNRSATFSTTTAGGTQATIGAFSFAPQTGVVAGALTQSEKVTISVSGTTSVPVRIFSNASSARFSVNGGTFTAAPSAILNGQTVQVQHQASALDDDTVVSTLVIGNKSAIFSTSTAPATAAAFSFAPTTISAAASTQQASNPVTVVLTGGSAAPISISSGGAYSINGGSFVTTRGSVVNGDQVRVHNTTSATAGASVASTLTIANQSATFTTVTTGGTVPAWDFTLGLQSGASAGSTAVSQPFTATTDGAITITEGEYRIDNGSFTSAPGTVAAGHAITVRHAQGSAAGQTVTTIITIGTKTGAFITQLI